MDWLDGIVQMCIVGESFVIWFLCDYLYNMWQVFCKDIYIFGYWKIGLVEDEYQKLKCEEVV